MLEAYSSFLTWQVPQAYGHAAVNPGPQSAARLQTSPGNAKPASRSLPMLPSPRSAKRAAPSPVSSAADDFYDPMLDNLRGGLSRLCLSLTSISSRAQACFAQFAAVLAYDRAMRDMRLAQQAVADAGLFVFRPSKPPPIEGVLFWDTLNVWWQGCSAAASFWGGPIFGPSTNPLTQLAKGSAFQPPAPSMSPWEAWMLPAQAQPWRTFALCVPGLAAESARQPTLQPALLGFWWWPVKSI